MRPFSLGERLSLCASMVRPGAALADVGTDHGYLPVWLAQRGLIRSAVACDVRPGPLSRAERNIRKYGVEQLVSARLSDGLDAVLPEEADDVAVAGMGGLMIAEIIGRAAWLRSGEKRLILQPMTRAEELRRSLSQMGFAVLREEAVREEGRVYSAMLCAFLPERRVSNPLFPYIGGLSAGTPESRAYIRREEKRLRARAGGLRHQGETEKADGLFAVAASLDDMLGQNGEEQE